MSTSTSRITVVPTMVFGLSGKGGNPGPVVLGAEALDTERMQALARDLGAEAAFVLPASASADVRLRFFTPERELGMCVHSIVAAITVLVRSGLLPAQPQGARVEGPAGVVTATWTETDDGLVVAVEQFPPTFEHPIDRVSSTAAALFDALRSDVTIADFAIGPLQVVSVSRSKLLLPIQNAEQLDAIEPDWECLWDFCDHLGTTGVYVFTLRPRDSDTADVDARQFPVRAGFVEDPATGVAAAALGAYLWRLGRMPGARVENWNRMRVAQGHAMGRTSIIEVDVSQRPGYEIRTRVGGRASIVDTHDSLVQRAAG